MAASSCYTVSCSQARLSSTHFSTLEPIPGSLRKACVPLTGYGRIATCKSAGEREEMGRSTDSKPNGAVGRRAALSQSVLLAGAYSGLFFSGSSTASEPDKEPKQRKLSIEQIKNIIERDISQGQYFVTGDLTKSIYRDDCKFKDPTNTTVGLEKYLQAIAILFEPATSKQELLSINVTGPNTVDARWTLGGYLKFPWHPRVTPFEGSTQYTVDNDGLVSLHNESWSISPVTALIESFTPSFK